MKQVKFVNFIGFGKRVSIDIRLVYGPEVDGKLFGVPEHIVCSDEFASTGDSDGVHASFNELAERLLLDLVKQLNDAGLSALAVELSERFAYIEAIARRRNGVLDNSKMFADLLGMIYELNAELFRVEV